MNSVQLCGSTTLIFRGEYAKALTVNQEAHALAQEIGTARYIAISLFGSGEAYCMLEQYEEAKQCHTEGLELMREIGDLMATGQRLARIASIALAQGDVVQAKALCRQALVISRECQDQVGLSWALLEQVKLATLEGNYQRAALLLGAADTILESNPIARRWPHSRNSYEASVERLRVHLHESDFRQLWARGQAMPREQTVALALLDPN